MYCRNCGVEILADSVYCVSCGTPVSSLPKPYEKPEEEPGYERTEPDGQQKLEDFYSGFKFPEITVPPRIGRALTLGWDIMMQDIVGVILVALAFILLSLLSVIPILGYFIVVALQVGMIGWAEERRRGIQSGPGAMVRIALNRFTESLLLALVLIAVSIVITLPLFIAYFGFFISIITAAVTASSSSSHSVSSIPYPTLLMGPVMLLLAIAWVFIFGLVGGPLIASMQSMVAWGIANGKSFQESLAWAWERMKSNVLGWWIAGFVINIISGLGVYLCYVGMLITYPWSVLSWAVIVSDSGESESLSKLDK
jgi:hypothetical protein